MTIRPPFLIAAALSLIAIIVGGYSMAARVSAFNELADRELYVYSSVLDRAFTYAGRDVRIVDTVKDTRTGEPPDPTEPDPTEPDPTEPPQQREPDPATPEQPAQAELPFGAERVLIHYGDETLELVPTMKPEHEGLPGVTRHMNWMRIVRFAERSGLSVDELEEAIEKREVLDRLAVVVFEPPRGADPKTYGEVWKRDAWFSFHELLPEGGFRSQRLKFPESERSFERRTNRALRAGEPAPERPEYELRPRSWQYGAAQIVRSGRDQPTMLPGSMSPDLAFSSDALSAMGWTLPLTSIGTLAFVVSLALAFAPRRHGGTKARRHEGEGSRRGAEAQS